MTADAVSCEHPDVRVLCEFSRITESEGGPVAGFMLDVHVECESCNMPFCFRGMPPGLSHMAPRASIDAKTASLPIHPEDDPTTGIGLSGFNVSVR